MDTPLVVPWFGDLIKDYDLCLHTNTKPDGTPYWEYVLCYVDDVLAISLETMAIISLLDRNVLYNLRGVKEPTEYLRAQVRKHELPNGRTCWDMSSDLYVERAIADVNTELATVNQTLTKRASTSLSGEYRPERDQSFKLDAKKANYY